MLDSARCHHLPLLLPLHRLLSFWWAVPVLIVVSFSGSQLPSNSACRLAKQMIFKKKGIDVAEIIPAVVPVISLNKDKYNIHSLIPEFQKVLLQTYLQILADLLRALPSSCTSCSLFFSSSFPPFPLNLFLL